MFGTGKESLWLGNDAVHGRLLFGTGFIASMEVSASTMDARSGD
jgi:hypothetical protein